MTSQRKFNPRSIILLVLVLLLALNVVRSMRSSGGITYGELRELFVQEKVEKFTINEHTLTATLKDESAVVCFLHNFDLFYDDLNDLVVEQYDKGIISEYNYYADHSTNWLQLLLPYVLAVLAFILLMNLMGRIELNPNLDNPFKMASTLLHSHEGEYDIAVLDFHAEATSEKGAMAWYLDGKAQAVWGTHTHVPTADCQILPKGCGFVTDLGMTGPKRSVLGIKPADSLNIFLGGLPRRHEEAEGSCKLNAVLFTIDTEKKKCVGVKRVDIEE
jgi:calcineurin-like phosphoesterase